MPGALAVVGSNPTGPTVIRKKYTEMILDAARSILGYFGFDRTAYGDKNDTTPRKLKWLQELKQQRENDIKTEAI